jgi:hypothetical protein
MGLQLYVRYNILCTYILRYRLEDSSRAASLTRLALGGGIESRSLMADASLPLTSSLSSQHCDMLCIPRRARYFLGVILGRSNMAFWLMGYLCTWYLASKRDATTLHMYSTYPEYLFETLRGARHSCAFLKPMNKGEEREGDILKGSRLI